MLLTIKTRQKYLKALGMYDGKIDGKEGVKTKKGYRLLQNKYFTRNRDKDGIYGTDTDILLRNAYAVEAYTRNFDLPEFKCGCGGEYCTGYPVVLNTQLLKNLQAIRTKYGAITITSGIRCKKYNNSLNGSSSISRHMKGKAVDIHLAITKTVAGRKSIMNYWKSLPKYNYTYCNINGNYPNMGDSVHCDVK